MRVGIDIGHSQFSAGASSSTGQPEFAFNERFARELLVWGGSRPGLDLFLVNPGSEKLSLKERPQRAESAGADVFLSIHHDSVNDKYLKTWMHGNREQRYTDAFMGHSLFVSQDNPKFAASRRLAELIGRNLRAAGLVPTLHHAEPIKGEGRTLLDPELGVYEAPFAVLRLAKIPAVLVEAGVITNREEEAKLETVEHRQRMGKALLDALEAYCAP